MFICIVKSALNDLSYTFICFYVSTNFIHFLKLVQGSVCRERKDMYVRGWSIGKRHKWVAWLENFEFGWSDNDYEKVFALLK